MRDAAHPHRPSVGDDSARNDSAPGDDHRMAIIAEARTWLGTPYQHQTSTRGAGCDCLGLVRGVWRGVIGGEPEIAPAYTPHWAETSGEETLHAAAQRHLIEVDQIQNARPGDVLLFRMTRTAPMKHAAILTAPDRIIHAYWGRAVVETALIPWWQRRIAAAFAFPPPTPRARHKRHSCPSKPKGETPWPMWQSPLP